MKMFTVCPRNYFIAINVGSIEAYKCGIGGCSFTASISEVHLQNLKYIDISKLFLMWMPTE